MENKKISVIMGIYNCEKTLERAVESIVDQTYPNWELIMCDDGSTDDTYQVAKRIAAQHPDKMKLLHDDKNYHLAHALNHCLKEVTGDYIARMDADDESMPDRFEKQVAYLNTHPEFILCGTQILIKSELSGKNYVAKIEQYPDKYTLHRRTPFNHATIMCRKEMYKILGGYSEAKTAVRCEDQDLWFRFFEKELHGANILEPLYTVVEDKEMIFRIKPTDRWNSFVTAYQGYKALHYPLGWFFKLVIRLAKMIIPKQLLSLYFAYRKRE